MALIKPITLDNGITVTYHRVTSVHNITNAVSIIEISSYTSKEKRLEEKSALKENAPMDVYLSTRRIPVPYQQSMDAKDAYEYIKTLDEYKNAEDD